MSDTLSESSTDGGQPTTSLSDSDWSVSTRALPWSEKADPPDQPGTPRPQVTATSTDPYARPVHAPSGYPYATWWRRFTAFMIDGVVILVAWVALWFAIGPNFSGGRTAYLVADIAGGIYFVILTAGARGQTPGMRATGIAVRARNGGGAIGYSAASIRSLVMSVFAAPGFIPFALECLFPLWQKERQAIHDMMAGSVVVEVRNGLSTEPARVASPPVRQAAATGGTRSTRAEGSDAAMVTAATRAARATARIVTTRSRRFWIVIVTVIVAAAGITTAATLAVSYISAQHTPQKAAIAYLDALSTTNASPVLANAGIVAPTDVAPNVNVLLSKADIARELASSGNAIGHVTDVTVVSSSIEKGGTAKVTLTYLADSTKHRVSYSLITSDSTPAGWAVQVYPSRLDIDLPTGEPTATVDGMHLTLDGQMAHVYLFPGKATISAPATAIWKRATATVDTTGQNPNGDPQEVPLTGQLRVTAQASAIQAVANQIDNCLAATSLTPGNCPNNDIPADTNQGDTYSNIAWTGLGQPTAGLVVNVDKYGGITVAGSMTAEVNYTDTSNTDPWNGPMSNQATDGPFNIDFSYPLTWSGNVWVLGTVTGKNLGIATTS